MSVITSGEVASSRLGSAMAVEAVLVPEGNNVEEAMAMSANTNSDETRRRISVNDADWGQAERSTLGEVREQGCGAEPSERATWRGTAQRGVTRPETHTVDQWANGHFPTALRNCSTIPTRSRGAA